MALEVLKSVCEIKSINSYSMISDGILSSKISLQFSFI